MKTPIAIIGSGNIGTDLLIKIIERSPSLEAVVLVGIDEASEGLARARALGIDTTWAGIDGLVAHPRFSQIQVVFDATSATAHQHHAKVLAEHGKRVIDLTPAAIGPYVVPVANLEDHIDAPNVNMVTCGGQATIPIVWACGQVGNVRYAEIVASISSRSAGPGTRANIDEFTQTTSRGLEVVGGAERGKAIIVLNPADPPLIMRDTVYTFVEGAEPEAITASIEAAVARVAAYVPGYRLVKPPVYDDFREVPVRIPGFGEFNGWKVTTLLEVEGAGDWLPKYAGNLDIMTSAALRMGELIAERIAG
jgi:acetaldehyde dehydrogenase